jgi:hypothetical protein
MLISPIGVSYANDARADDIKDNYFALGVCLRGVRKLFSKPA